GAGNSRRPSPSWRQSRHSRSRWNPSADRTRSSPQNPAENEGESHNDEDGDELAVSRLRQPLHHAALESLRARLQPTPQWVTISMPCRDSLRRNLQSQTSMIFGSGCASMWPYITAMQDSRVTNSRL